MKRWVVPVICFAVLMAMVVAFLAVGYRSLDRSGHLGPAVTAAPVPSPDATSTPSPSGDTRTPPDPALEPFYSQVLDWQPCEGSFECATLEVPVDYADPSGETIGLALLRVPAGDSSARVGSLVVNPGGPGAPGTDYAARASDVFTAPVRDAFDIVGFDPRGTGDSAPVDCLSDEQLSDYLASDPDPDDQAEIDAMGEWVDRFGQGCVDKTDELIGHVTTIETARDIDVLRAALEEPALHFLGASYGTKLGATYADLFPERVGRMVLDGAVDVSLSSRDLSLGQAEGFQRALSAYVENCVEETDDCFLGDDVDAGLQRIRDFLDEVDAEPLPTGTDRELTQGLALYGLITPLYNRDYWYLLDQGLQQAFQGDGQLLLLLSDAYSSRNPDGSFADNSMEALYSINCLDDPWAVPVDEVEEQIPDFEAVSPTLGRTFAWMLTSCGGIQVESSEPARDLRAAGAAPILVVGTTRDPATPYEWAVALADQLESGVLLSRDGDGHTGYNSGNACVDDAIEAFLIDDVVPEDGTSC